MTSTELPHPHLRDEASTDALPVAPALGASLDAARMPRRSTLVEPRVLLITALAIVLGVGGGLHRAAAGGADRRWSPTSRSTGASRRRSVSPAGHHLGAVGDRGPGDRRPDRRRDGALRLAGDPRPRHPRGDGAGAAQREPHPAARSRSSSRCRRRSRSAPAARSAPKARSSPPAARSARCSGSCCTSPPTSARRCSPPAPPAGMAATFGSPVSAVLLAVELLLFEFRPRSLIPVALASVAAAGVRIAFVGTDAGRSRCRISRSPAARRWRATSLLGALIGWLARRRHARRLRRSRTLRAAADPLDVVAGDRRPRGRRRRLLRAAHARRRLRQHRGHRRPATSRSARVALPVRDEVHLLVDLARQRHLGRHAGAAVHHRRRRSAALGGLRRGRGRAAARASTRASPALVGMAAIFAGASRALLASVVFAFETTLQPLGLLPLLGGCTAATSSRRC